MAGRRGSNGYMIIAEIFARPMLVNFALLMAMTVVDPFLKFASSLFINTMDTVNADSISGVVTFLVFIVIYSSFCLSMVNRIFSLITFIPKSVLRYIGTTRGGTHDQGQYAANAIRPQTKRGLTGDKDAIAGAIATAAVAREKRSPQTAPDGEEGPND